MSRRDTREQLLEGALTCIQDKGLARTTVRDVAAAAGGANLGSIVYHFGTKERLLDEALSEGFRRWLSPLVADAVMRGLGSPRDQLREGIRIVLDSIPANRPLLVAYVEAIAQAQHSTTVRDEVRTSYRELRALLGALVCGLLDDGSQEPVDGDAVAAGLLALFDGIAIQALIDPQTPDADRIATAVETAFNRLV